MGLLGNPSDIFLKKYIFTMWFTNSTYRYLPTLNENICSHECKNDFYIFKGLENDEYVIDMVFGSQIWKYLVSGALQKNLPASALE